jgi:spore germination protein GerM
VKRSKQDNAPQGAAKEKILRLLFLFFVFFLVGFFIYFAGVTRVPQRISTVKIFFYSGERLKAVVRPVAPGVEPAKIAAAELLKGPTAAEKKSGLFTQIPGGTKLLGLTIEDSVAVINLSKRAGDYGGGTSQIQAIISQIVYTLTEIPGIKKVGFLIEGKAKVAIGGEGYVIEQPLGREDMYL